MNWILPAVTVGLGIVLIVSGVLHLLRERSHRKRLANVKRQRDRLNLENESLYQANGDQAKQNLDLHAQLADRNEALQEATAELKSLQLATIPLQEAITPLSYAETKPIIEKAAQSSPVKRPTRKKAETQ